MGEAATPESLRSAVFRNHDHNNNNLGSRFWWCWMVAYVWRLDPSAGIRGLGNKC